MDNLVEQVNQMLNDSNSMQKIMEIASALQGNNGYGLSDIVPQQTNDDTTPIDIPISKDDKQQALVRALLPYLHPRHQLRLQKAIGIAKMSKAAEAILRSGLLTRENEEANNGI